MNGVVYAYNPKYFEKSVINWLDKVCARKISVDVYVQDVEKWDAMLWNRHPFLPHSFERITQYDKIRLLDRAVLQDHDGKCKVVVVFEPEEGAECNLPDAVWFVDSSSSGKASGADGSGELTVYKQSDSGQWIKTR